MKLVLGQGHCFSILTLPFSAYRAYVFSGVFKVHEGTNVIMKGDYFGRKKSISENVKKEKGKTYRPILGKDL